MKSSNIALGFALAGALAVAGCSSNDSNAPDGGGPDGGEGGGVPDGGPHDGGAHHKLTSRGLLGTSTRNLLLDPFVTTDTSLGHFIGLAFYGNGGSYNNYAPNREMQSLAPAGVALPIADLDALGKLGSGFDKLQIIAPLPGGSTAFEAAIWVSAGDADGKPVAFVEAEKELSVTLLPNDQPTKAYPLVSSGKPVTFGKRSWVKLALAAPVHMPEGGWFSIASSSPKWSFEVQAPEVTPSGAPGALPPAHSIARGSRDSAALAGYAEIVRRKH